MNWDQTYKQLKDMEGLTLRSISAKTDIKLLEVTEDQIIVLTRSGEKKTRPTNELRRIVERMESLSPVHIDSVLHGSGSSRNQPETILANMPDVEWARIND